MSRRIICRGCVGAQGKRDMAEPFVREALELEIDKDAFHPDTVAAPSHRRCAPRSLDGSG
jgi:hypothetical protein